MGWLHTFAASLLLVPLGAWAAAVPVQLVEAPRGLAWSSAEVARATAQAAGRVIGAARRHGTSGCRTHCASIVRVWAPLARVIERQRRMRGGLRPIRLHVVQDAEVEAFAVPDGRIVLSEAFVRRNRLDDAQLAFVLAHEAAHVLLEHERRTLTDALSLLPRNVPRTVADIYTEIDFNLGLLRRIEPGMQQTEYEADELGLYLAALAGHAPAAQRVFMQREAAQPAVRALASTHPPAVQRLARIDAAMPLAVRLRQSAGRWARVGQPARASHRPHAPQHAAHGG